MKQYKIKAGLSSKDAVMYTVYETEDAFKLVDTELNSMKITKGMTRDTHGNFLVGGERAIYTKAELLITFEDILGFAEEIACSTNNFP